MPRKTEPAYETENGVFPKRLKEIMKERGENQTSLAKKITEQYVTIQRQTISLYMNGQSKPDTERLTALARALDVSADWLLGLTDYRAADMETRFVCEYLGLTEKAVDAIEGMDDTARDVLGFLAEQEYHAFDEEPYFYFLQRLSDFFRVCTGNKETCYITGAGEILPEEDIDCLYDPHDFSELVPIKTGEFVEEAFLSEIRSMLISLKEEYHTNEK